MEDPRKGKDHETGHEWAPTSPDERREDVSSHEVIDWFIPCSPVRPDARTVPPVHVELAIREAHNLCQSVQERLEQSEKSRKPDNQRDCG